MQKDLLIRFVDFLTHEKQFSPHTVLAYNRDVRFFLDFFSIEIATVDSMSQLGRTEVKMWLYDLVESGQGSNTIKRKIASLNRFYKYICKWEDLNKNLFSGLIPPKVSKEVVRPFSVAEIEALYCLETEDKTAKDICIVLLNTGLRVSELINLRKENLDIEGLQIKVVGKGNKERILPLSAHIAKMLHERSKSVHHYLFEQEAKPLTRYQVYHKVRSLMAQVSTKDKVYTHLTRHTFASQLLESGADIIHVKELLGHESLAATQHYAHSDLKKLKRAHQLAHPRNY